MSRCLFQTVLNKVLSCDMLWLLSLFNLIVNDQIKHLIRLLSCALIGA